MPDIAEMTRAIAQLTEVRSLIGSCMLREMRERLEGDREGSIKQGDTLGLFNDTFVGETRSSLRIALQVLEECLSVAITNAEKSNFKIGTKKGLTRIIRTGKVLSVS